MKAMLELGVGVTCVVLLTGCQLIGGPSDETLISELLDTFKESLLAQDVDRNMSLFSESLAVQGQVVTKQDLRELWKSGVFDNSEISIDEAKIVMNDDGTATVSGVKVKAPDGDSMRTYTLVKEEGDSVGR